MINDPMAHFEKLLDEFEEDALAAARDNSNTPSASKRRQYSLTRRNILALVEEIVLDDDSARNAKEEALRQERDLIHNYLYDAVGDMAPVELSEASGLDDLHYCIAIIGKAREYKT